MELALLEVTTELADPRAELPQARQLAGRECNPTHQQIIGLKLYKQGPGDQTKTQFFPCQSLPSGSLHKPLSLLHQRAGRISKRHSPKD